MFGGCEHPEWSRLICFQTRDYVGIGRSLQVVELSPERSEVWHSPSFHHSENHTSENQAGKGEPRSALVPEHALWVRSWPEIKHGKSQPTIEARQKHREMLGTQERKGAPNSGV